MIIPLTFVISAWIPYATESRGIPDASAHIQNLTEVNPFVYDITGTSTITDEGGVGKGEWNAFFTLATSTKIIATIVWGSPSGEHNMFSSTSTRAAHIASIMSIVDSNNFSGIDIDYEAMNTSDHGVFVNFLQSLSSALHGQGKILSCTVEAKDIEYQGIASACDEVKIMTYDEYYYAFGSNTFSTSIPLSISVGNTPLGFDISQITDAEKYIPKNKIVLGIPTYGYDFTYTIRGTIRTVTRYATYSYADAIALAQKVGANIYTSPGGERYFLYTSAGKNHFVVYDDAAVLADRVALAQTLGLGGVAIFKIDGKEDSNIWSDLK